MIHINGNRRKREPEIVLRDAIEVGANQDYYEWLYSLVDLPNHRELLKHLRRIDFYELIPHDHNRAEDGKSLRTIYLDIGGAHSPSSVTNCSVLEMMVGVAFRMEHELVDLDESMDVAACFLALLDNVDLSWMTDHKYNGGNGPDVVDDKVYTMLDRCYTRAGKGGLFPLRRPDLDQREVEIHYQMQAWMMENYVFW